MGASLDALAVALPEGLLLNDDLVEATGWSAEKIAEKTGINQRHIAGSNETSSDLAVAAAQRLFATGRIAPNDIDFVLLCTQSPDYFLPTTACIVQDRLRIPTSAGALDFNLGCSGYVYGLALAKGLIASGEARRVLLLTAETYSKFIHPGDRSVRTLFGDGAAASLVTAVDTGRPEIGSFTFGTDGSGAANLIVPTGGLREPRTPESSVPMTDESGNSRARDNLFMNGAEIFTFTLREIPRVIARLLERTGTTMESYDHFVFHQANAFMLEHLRKKLKVPADKFVVALHDVGNTVSSTIPIALHRAAAAGKIREGARIMLVGFGVGYSWGACSLTWGNPALAPL